MHVLHIEDNPVDADLVKRALTRCPLLGSVEVTLVFTCAQALERLQPGMPFDVVLADLNLPDGNGLDLIKAVRARSLPAAVVALTGQGDEEKVMQALRAGADDYLAKSEDLFERLSHTVRAALDRRRIQAVRSGKLLRVLYVEHDLSDIELTRRHLERCAVNLQLSTATTLGEALAALKRDSAVTQDVDVVLCDYSLVGDSGLELLKVIRDDLGSDIPVVMVTGQGSEDVAAHAMRLGATDYLVKRDDYLPTLPMVLENAYYRVAAAREQAALQRSEQRLALVLEGSSDAWWDYLVETDEAFISPRLWQLLGHADAPKGRSLDTLRGWVHQEEQACVRERLSQLLEGTANNLEGEVRLRHAKGHHVPLLVRGLVSRNAQGGAVRLSGTCIDLTERKRAEAEILALNNSVEARVEERTAELLLATRRAENASRAKSEFLSHMSHELRTPMNAVLGFAQLLELTPLAERQLTWATEIRRAGGHLLMMIEDLLDLARLEVGKVAVRMESLALRTIIDEAMPIVRPLLANQEIQILEEGLNDVPMVWADALRLRQVLVNLLSNAIKYNRRGGTVSVMCERIGHAVRVSVSDTGIGMSPEKLERLFQPFERLGAEQGKIEGTGIGLALSYQLATLMGSELRVESREGVGSVFWLELPIENSDAPEQADVVGSP